MNASLFKMANMLFYLTGLIFGSLLVGNNKIVSRRITDII